MNFMNARGNTKLNAAVGKVESNVAEQDATGKKNGKTDIVRKISRGETIHRSKTPIEFHVTLRGIQRRKLNTLATDSRLIGILSPTLVDR